jgi:hypothetical protein
MLQSSLDEIKEDAMDSVIDDDTLSKQEQQRPGVESNHLLQGSPDHLANMEAGAAQQSHGDGRFRFGQREAAGSTHSTTITKKLGPIGNSGRGLRHRPPRIEGTAPSGGINDSYYEHEPGYTDLNDVEAGIPTRKRSPGGTADATEKNWRIRDEAIVEVHEL